MAVDPEYHQRNLQFGADLYAALSEQPDEPILAIHAHEDEDPIMDMAEEDVEYLEEDEDQNSEEDRDVPVKKSSLPLTSFNFVNAIVGSGVIGMPFALRSAGFGFGLLILLLVALVADASLCLLIAVAQKARVKTYQDLVWACFGKPGFVIVSTLQFLYPFISLISYNIIVGDTMTKVFNRVIGVGAGSVLVKREFIVSISTLCITLPLSLFRNISKLAKVSLVSIFMTLIIVSSMLARLFTMRDTVPTTEGAWAFQGNSLGAAIGVMTFAFMCHHACFLVYESLEDNTQGRWNLTTHISIGVSVALSLAFAVVGYVTFTGYSQGDVFDNYCWTDDLMNVCRGLFAFEILLTFPIECFVARDVLMTTFFKRKSQRNPLLPRTTPRLIFRHAIVAVAINISCMIISMCIDCLGVVLELNGIICAVPLAYIFPASCYLKLDGVRGPWNRQRFLALGVGVFGLVSFVMGIVSFISNIKSISQCSHGKQMPYCFPVGKNDTLGRS